jgi:hypothetical protein
MSNATPLPVWNKRSTPAERFTELARLAEANPQKYHHVIVGWANANDPSGFDTGYTLVNCDTMQLLGLLELVRAEIFRTTTVRVQS